MCFVNADGLTQTLPKVRVLQPHDIQGGNLSANPMAEKEKLLKANRSWNVRRLSETGLRSLGQL